MNLLQELKKVQNELENTYQEQVQNIDAEAVVALKNYGAVEAISLLTEYSRYAAANTVKRWKELDNYLLVKYLDSNVKQEENGEFIRNGHGYPVKPKQPGYPDSWKKKVIEETGDRFKR